MTLSQQTLSGFSYEHAKGRGDPAFLLSGRFVSFQPTENRVVFFVEEFGE
jgi:hypothetical protein